MGISDRATILALVMALMTPSLVSASVDDSGWNKKSSQTPAILTIQNRMKERFQSQLRPLLDNGVLALDSEGWVVVKDASLTPLRERVSIQALVAEENRDRKAVYRELSLANGHPEWEKSIRLEFAKEWLLLASKNNWWIFTDGQFSQ